MKVRTYLFYCSSAFVIDQVAGLLVPGTLWLLPLVLLAMVVVDDRVHEHMATVLFVAIIADIFGGLPFGFVLLTILVITFIVQLLRYRIHRGLVPLSLALFMVALAFPLSWGILKQQILVLAICFLIPTLFVGMMKMR